MTAKDVFEEAGRFHRYILNWRQAAFAGYIAAVYAVATLALQWVQREKFVAFGILLLACPLGWVLEGLDRRNRQLYHAAQSVAAEIQSAAAAGGPIDARTPNFYQRLMDSHTIEFGDPGLHTRILHNIYSGYSWATLLAAISIFAWALVDAAKAAV